MPRPSLSLTAVSCIFFCVVSVCPAGGGDRWDLLRQLPHDAGFTFIDRDRTCYFGQLAGLTDQWVAVDVGKSKETILKSNLLYVQRGHYSDTYGLSLVMYSGRSSWADILAFMALLTKAPAFKLRMIVMTSGGKRLKGDLKQVTENEISIRDDFGKETRLTRVEVSKVDYIQDKPLSDKEEFDWDELAMLRIFDPVLYPRLFHAGDRIRVNLYDRSLNQDDSPLFCK